MIQYSVFSDTVQWRISGQLYKRALDFNISTTVLQPQTQPDSGIYHPIEVLYWPLLANPNTARSSIYFWCMLIKYSQCFIKSVPFTTESKHFLNSQIVPPTGSHRAAANNSADCV